VTWQHESKNAPAAFALCDAPEINSSPISVRFRCVAQRRDMLKEPVASEHTMHTEDLVFIDTEFSPLSGEWLSVGAVLGQEMFYAETGDPRILKLAELEFYGNPVGRDVLGQLGNPQFPPGVVVSPSEMARAFFAWMARVARSGRVVANN